MPSKLQPPCQAPLWKYTADDIKTQLDAALAAAKATHDQIAALPPGERNHSNVFTVFAQTEANILNLEPLQFLQFVTTDGATRDASEAAELAINEFKTEYQMRPDLFQTFVDARENALKDDGDKLTSEDRRYMDKVILDGKRAGLALSEDDRVKYKQLQKDLDALKVEYHRNINTAKGFVAFTREELEGVPDNTLSKYKELEDGRLAVTHRDPDFGPVLRYAKSGETRRTLWLSHQNRVPENGEVFDKMVSLRRQLAEILGYPTWADYITEVKMAGSAKVVTDFLDDLENKLVQVGESDRAVLLALKSELEGVPLSSTLDPWDQGFYQGIRAERELNLDSKIIQDYFPVSHVVPAILKIYQEMFDVDFVELSADVECGDVWHEDVLRYAVWEAGSVDASGFIGYAYFDLYSRDDKYGGNAMWQITNAYERPDGTRETPVAAIVANLSKPSPNEPATMTHFLTVQLFHEIGHVFHGLFSVTKYARFHGTAGPTDWAEAPSQMLENWCWQPSVLKRVAKHHQTGEPLSDELAQKLAASRTQNVGLFRLFQVFIAKHDITAHIDKEGRSYTELWGQIRRNTGLINVPEPFLPSHAAIGHWANGYEAGYYGYSFSDVYAVDMWATVFKQDPWNKEAARRYRQEVLLPGAAKEEMSIISDFLGRAPNAEAYFKQLLG